MSSDTDHSETTQSATGSSRSPPIERIENLLGQTAVAVRGALSRWDGRVSFLALTVLYLLTYLWSVRHLTATGTGRFDLFVVSDPIGMAVTRQSAFLFEPIARVEAGPIIYLFSPINVGIGLALGVLVGTTIAVSIVSWRSPAACRIGTGAGATAGIPGLISGFACCGPQLLVVIGLQASAGLIAAMQWMVPLAVVSLIATLLWVGSRVQVAPASG